MNKKIFSGSVVAFGLSALMTLCGARDARADGKVCNQYTSGIWYSIAMDDSGCSGSAADKYRETSWWFVAKNTCVTFWNGPLTNRRFYTYAIAEDGHQWPSPGANVFAQNWSGSSGVCKNLVELSCTNAGSNCQNVSHFFNNFTGKTVGLYTDTYTNTR